jgi:hypothetical protein
MEASAATLDDVRARLGDAAEWGDTGERVVTRDLTYGDGDLVEIVVRKRGWRYDLDDRGDAVAKARALGAGHGWLELAERLVAKEGFNVNRSGVVGVPAVEGRDIAQLAFRLSGCAYAVHSVLLESAQD